MKKTKMGIGKTVLIVILAIITVLAILTPFMIALNNGAFSKGNADEYSAANAAPLESSPLAGKQVIFLGSSVTYGSASKGESFVEYMIRRDGITAVKEAVSGTTLVDNGEKSYIQRMLSIKQGYHADAFVCQLSTNDATQKKPLGEISDSFEMSDFDTQTIAGAIEYVICYAKQTWNCPVIFYTGTKYDSKPYGEMVSLLLEIQKKWDIGVIDLWNDPEMNAVSAEEYKLYMVNGIHPSRAGYLKWWTPKFEAYLSEYLT